MINVSPYFVNTWIQLNFTINFSNLIHKTTGNGIQVHNADKPSP